MVQDELADLLGAQGKPLFCELIRWSQKMPQYHIGHRRLVAEIHELAAARPGLALAGNAYDGVGIPQCIGSSVKAIAQLFGNR